MKKSGLWFHLFFFMLCIVTNILALKNILFHAQFIPGDLKDGNYGFMGGASFGAIILNLMVASFILGLLLKLSKNDNVTIGEEKCSGSTKDLRTFPEWFNRISHSISGCMVGSAVGIFWLSLANGKPIEDYGDLTIGSIIGAAGIYTIAGIIALIQKLKNCM